MPAEVVGYCVDELFLAGALDVFTAPIQMKKNRPGVLLSAIAAAVATLIESTPGAIGIQRHRSAAATARSVRPGPSAPTRTCPSS